MSAPPRFCRECRWFRLQDDGRPPLCGHPSSLHTETSPVTGEESASRVACWLARIFLAPEYCAPEGQFWEPAEIGFGDP